jgi:hypothetical protein
MPLSRLISSNRVHRLLPGKTLLLTLTMAAVLLLTATHVLAASVQLTWKPNTEATLAGYKIHYGNSSRSYSTAVDVTRNTTCSISDIQPGKMYFFAATAYDINGNQSEYSNEVSYSIPAGNLPPVAQSGTLTVTEDQLATGTLRATDPEAKTLTFTLIAPPAKGVVKLNNTTTGAFTYTPNSSVNGADSFSFKASDGVQDSNTASISVNIAGTNDPPMAVSDQGAVTAGSSIAIMVLANDTDADGDTLSIASVTQGKNGKTVISGTSVKYTSTAAFSGTDSFSYTVTDGKGGNASGNVTIQALATNRVPLASNVSISTKANSSVSGKLSATDSDGDTLRFSLVTLPAKGKASITNTADGSFTYTANTGVTGTDSFTFKANDGKADSNIATVSITFTGSGQVVFAVNAGGPMYVDKNGIRFAADSCYSGGYTAKRTSGIADTLDDVLYQSERYGDFSYTIPVTNGYYMVTLKFAEMVSTASNQRVFDILMEGREVITNLDIFASAGRLRAYDVRVPVRVADGSLNLNFRTDKDNAKLSAILVEQLNDGCRWGVNAGGTRYVDGTGMVYEHDVLYSAGSTAKTTAPIVGTEDSSLYQTERYGTFSYNIPIPNGVYRVTLKFAEIAWNAPGKRVFGVSIEGQQEIADLDLLLKVSKYESYDYPVMVTVNDGVLNLKFASEVNHAMLSAVLIEGL